jgi:hypothetical protein
MLNALVTLPFLIAAVIAGLAIWHTVAESAAKVLAALKGESHLARSALATRPVTVRYAPRQVPARAPVRTAAQWRAAA